MKRLPRLKISPTLKNFLIHVLLAFIFGAFWYWMIYGIYPLFFTHVNWIYKAGGDMLQHQLGWEWFRQEAWQFPLGKISGYGYPIGTSVTFMDAIPLFAIPMKLIAPLFKANHQYFGLWEFTSVFGQMLVGLLILHEFTRSYWVKILGASMLVLSPVMIFRAFYHSSLSAHWILLLAIWFILLEYRNKLWRGAWICLFAVAVLINIYFIPMLVPLWLIALYFRIRRDRKSPQLIRNILIECAAIFLAAGLVGYSIGLFSLSTSSLSASGYGDFSWNLNGFINPYEYSSIFIRGRDTGVDTQFEGFSYLGLGNLLLIPTAVYIFLEREGFKQRVPFLVPFCIAALVYMLYSLSSRAFFDGQPLWDVQLPESFLTVFSLFRSSGRFIWPVFYFLVLFGIIAIIRNVRFPALILFVVVLLQFIDIQPLYQPKKLSGITTYQSSLQSEFWSSAAQTNEHMVIIPAKKLRPPYEPFAEYAVRNGLTLNLGYFARYDAQAFEEYSQNVWEDLQAHQSDTQTIYVLSDPEYTAYARANLAEEMYICEIDGFTVLFSGQNELAQAKDEISPACSIPVR